MFSSGILNWARQQTQPVAVDWGVLAASVAQFEETSVEALAALGLEQKAPRAALVASEELFETWLQSMVYDPDTMLIEQYSVYAEQADTLITLGRPERAPMYIDYLAAVAQMLDARDLPIPVESLTIDELDRRYALARN